jgi:hypothetical protein
MEERRKRYIWRWRALTIWIVIFTIAVGLAINQNRAQDRRDHTQAVEAARLAGETSRLALANEDRIEEIQESRVISCKRTYEGIREVFGPFFPPPPRTKEEQTNLNKFNNRIDDLKSRCSKQTEPEKD